MEGVGKTTLAQAVLNDQRVQQHFDFKLWVHVSDVLDEKMVCKAISMSTMGRDPTKDDDEWSLVLNVNKLFLGKKYLLVLDDVRKGSPESWGRLILPLGGAAKGAKILVTTCNTTADEMTTGNAQVHQLEPLLEEDCWAPLQHLSSHRAGDHGVPRELEELGREIARKCRGIPLIGRRMGGLMRWTTRRQWELILNSKGWDLPPDMINGTILVELEVNHYNLPAQLRQFFFFWALSPNKTPMTKHLRLI